MAAFDTPYAGSFAAVGPSVMLPIVDDTAINLAIGLARKRA